MSKLTTKDIEIKFEGSQILTHIEERYGSLSDFIADSKLDAGEQSISRYLHSKKIKSKKNRFLISHTLGKTWEELVIPAYVQVERYINVINKNITQYNTPKDIPVIDRLIKICKSGIANADAVEEKDAYNLCLSMAYNTKSLMYFFGSEATAATLMIDNALEIIKAYPYRRDLRYFYFTNAGLIENGKMKRDAAANYYEAAIELDNGDISDELRYNLYYSYAVNLTDTKQYKRAIELLNKCITLAQDSEKKGKAYFSIGLAYQYSKDLECALNNYSLAYEMLNNSNKAMAYNNLSLIYKAKGDIGKAYECIKNAETFIKENTVPFEYEIVINFTEIEIGFNKKTNCEMIDTVFDKIEKNYNKIYPYTAYFINGLSAVIRSADKTELIKLQKRLLKLTKLIKKNKENGIFLAGLYECYIMIAHRLDK